MHRQYNGPHVGSICSRQSHANQTLRPIDYLCTKLLYISQCDEDPGLHSQNAGVKQAEMCDYFGAAHLSDTLEVCWIQLSRHDPLHVKCYAIKGQDHTGGSQRLAGLPSKEQGTWDGSSDRMKLYAWHPHKRPNRQGRCLTETLQVHPWQTAQACANLPDCYLLESDGIAYQMLLSSCPQHSQ